MNVNELLAMEQDIKASKKKLEQKQNKKNVHTLHEMFPTYDLSTLAAFYLQANKNLDRTIALLLSLNGTTEKSKPVQEQSVTKSKVDCDNDGAVLEKPAQTKSPVLVTANSILRSDRRIVLLSSLFPRNTFSDQEIYNVLTQCEGDVNICMMILMDISDERKEKLRRERLELERNERLAEQEKQWLQEEEEELQLQQDMQEMDQMDMTESREEQMSQFSTILNQLCEHYLSDEEDEHDNNDESGDEDDTVDDDNYGSDDNDDDNDDDPLDRSVLDSHQTEFDVVSDDHVVEEAFSTTMEHEKHKIDLLRLEKLVQDQEKMEMELLRILQNELNEKDMMDEIQQKKQQKDEEFHQRVIEENFLRKEAKAHYQKSLAISSQNWDYKNNDGIEENFKDIMERNYDSRGFKYLNEISSMITQLSTRRNIYVQSVFSDELAQKFEQMLIQLKRVYPDTCVQFAFHGSKEDNISNIVRVGLMTPGTKGFKHETDSGWYGRGIYLSPDAATSIHYCRGGGKLLVCATIPGRSYRCKGLTGKGCKIGYHSHLSPYGDEIVLFDSAQVLPLYVIHFQSTPYCTSGPVSALGFKNKQFGNERWTVKERYMRKLEQSKKLRLEASRQNQTKRSTLRNDGAHRQISKSRRRPNIQQESNTKGSDNDKEKEEKDSFPNHIIL